MVSGICFVIVHHILSLHVGVMFGRLFCMVLQDFRLLILVLRGRLQNGCRRVQLAMNIDSIDSHSQMNQTL